LVQGVPDGIWLQPWLQLPPHIGCARIQTTGRCSSLADAAPLAYDPWDPERVIVPPDAMLPITRLRELAAEYAATGHRPGGTQWKAVDYV
jgi:Immunity protein Imm1